MAGKCSPPGSSVHGVLQARILEWTAISFSRGSSRPRNQTRVSCIVGGFFTNWATREAPIKGKPTSVLGFVGPGVPIPASQLCPCSKEVLDDLSTSDQGCVPINFTFDIWILYNLHIWGNIGLLILKNNLNGIIVEPLCREGMEMQMLRMDCGCRGKGRECEMEGWWAATGHTGSQSGACDDLEGWAWGEGGGSRGKG